VYSNVAEVAKFERLVKFGRSGWWAIYHHYSNKNMLEFAGMKLTGMQNSLLKSCLGQRWSQLSVL
jgi:hypothetical protein